MICILKAFVATFAVFAFANPSGAASSPSCTLTQADAAWMQQILDGWTQATRAYLELNPEPLPLMVLFDSSCVWHLGSGAGEAGDSEPVFASLTFLKHPVAVYAAKHDGTVHLPNGAQIPANIMAAAFPYRDGTDAFFALAMPALWKQHPQASKDPHLNIRILSAALHEMIHTRQLPTLSRRVHALGQHFELPENFDDDVVESRFKAIEGFRSLFERERDLLFDAVSRSDPSERDSLAAEALAIAARRRAQYFTGADAPYAEIEGLFLNMEGVAEWVRYRYHQDDAAWPNDAQDILAFLRGTDNSWSQDEGLALVLLLDEMDPGWKPRMLGTEMASPWELLQEALSTGEGR